MRVPGDPEDRPPETNPDGGGPPSGPDTRRDEDAALPRRSEMDTVAGDAPAPATRREGADSAAAKGGAGAGGRAEAVGPYRILGELGRGGMGVVYKAFHEGLKRTVALKVLIAGEDASEEAITRFHREAEAVAKLGHHPNIVPIYDIGQAARGTGVGATGRSPLHYFAMHFVEGKPLDRLIDEGALAPRRAALIAKKIADALAHAHAHGILHRDVKPANILLARPGECRVSSVQCPEPEGPAPVLDTEHSTLNTHASPAEWEPMLTDFGLAKDAASGSKMTASGMALGTPQYMPPEQADGRLRDIDARSDVYSLGATLYEMLAGRPPFEGDSVAAVIRKVLLDEPRSPRKGSPAVDRDLETIVLKCLEKDPARRYASARELEEDLGRFLDGSPIRARPVSLLERVLRRARRNKALAAAVAAVVLLSAAGVVGGTWGARRLSEEKARREAESAAKEGAQAKQREADRIREKSQTVNRVMLGATSTLGFAHTELRKVWSDDARSAEDRQAAWDRHAESVEEFLSSAGSDPAARATALAVKGWLMRMGGLETEAFAAFRAARELDAEAPWGYLFEAMARLADVFRRMELPRVHFDSGGFRVAPMPAESEEKRRQRLAFEQAARRVPLAVWGEASAADFRAAMEALGDVGSGDPARIEKALSRALRVPEFAWVRGDLLCARVIVRFIQGSYEAGLTDAGRLVAEEPSNRIALLNRANLLNARAAEVASKGGDFDPLFQAAVDAHREWARKTPSLHDPPFVLGSSLLMWGMALRRVGRDPAARLREGIAALEEAVRLSPDKPDIRNNLASARVQLAECEAAWGRPALVEIEKAIAGYGEVLRIAPEHPGALANLAYARRLHAEILEKSGGDPGDTLRKGVEECGEALRLRPGEVEALLARAELSVNLGDSLHARGKDPSDAYRSAVEDCEAALRGGAEPARARGTRGIAWFGLARAARTAGRDSSEEVRRAAEDFTAQIEANPGVALPVGNRGNARVEEALNLLARGGDPGPALEAAMADYGRALELSPKTPHFMMIRANALTTRARWTLGAGGDPSRDLDAAEADCGTLLGLEPASAVGHQLRADVWHLRAAQADRGGRDARPALEAAIADFESAWKILPARDDLGLRVADEWWNVAGVQEKLGGDPREPLRREIAVLDAVLARSPRNAEARLKKATALHRTGESSERRGEDGSESHRQAASEAALALEAKPDLLAAANLQVRALHSLAASKMDRGEDAREESKAVAEVSARAVERFPGDAELRALRGDALRVRAMVLGQEGEDADPVLRQAVEAYDKAVGLLPSFWMAHVQRGRTLQELGAFVDAAESLRRAAELTQGREIEPRRLLEKAANAAGEPVWFWDLRRGLEAVDRGHYALARRMLESGLEKVRENKGMEMPGMRDFLRLLHYNRACIDALASAGRAGPKAHGRRQVAPAEAQRLRASAVEDLRKAFEYGWDDLEKIREDTDLDPLRDDSAYIALMKEKEKQPK